MGILSSISNWLFGDPVKKLETLEGDLNQIMGRIFVNTGVTSPRLFDLTGEIQSLTIAIRNRYENGTAEEKAQIENSGLIIDAKNKDGSIQTNPDGSHKKTVNNGMMFGIAKSAPEGSSHEERAEHILTGLQEKSEFLKITSEELQEGSRINQTFMGVNTGQNERPDHRAFYAIPIGAIYGAIDKDFDKFKDVVNAMHLAIRSGYSRIPTNRGKRELAEVAKGSNFNGKIFPDDPAYIRAMIRAGTRLNQFELSEIEAKDLRSQDIQDIQDGLKLAERNLIELQKELGGKIDLSGLIKSLQNYRDSTAKHDWSKIIPDFSSKAALYAETLPEGASQDQAEAVIDQFIAAFQMAAGTVTTPNSAKADASLFWLGRNASIKTRIEGKTVIKSDDFEFEATAKHIKGTNGTFGAKQAVQFILTAKEIYPQGFQIGEDGNNLDKALILKAYDELKKTMNLPPLTNVDEIRTLTAPQQNEANERFNEAFNSIRNTDGNLDFSKTPPPPPPPAGGEMALRRS